MYKRRIAFTFLLLANLILLAHTAIPHHHHQNLLCFEREHCADDGIPHEPGQPEQNHQHDNDPVRNLCLLADDFLSASSNFANRAGICQHNGGNQEYNPYLSCFSGNTVISSQPVTDIAFARHFYLLYSSISYAAFGSRPPPSKKC
jgi:hypothetical protein